MSGEHPLTGAEADPHHPRHLPTCVEKPVARGFTLPNLLMRFAIALSLVLLTYNPTPYSFIAWLRASIAQGRTGPEHWFVLTVLVIGWIIFFRATWRSLGIIGIVLTAGFFATLTWLLVDKGLVAAGNTQAILWIALVCLAGLLSIGMSWSHIRRRLSGQFDTDDVDT
jgi:hypothetical protein